MENMVKQIDSIQMSAFRDLENEIKKYLDKCGLFYKIFSRVKKGDSARLKIENRLQQGKIDYKLQDIVGFRLALYFKEDIDLCVNIIERHFEVVDIARDEEKIDKFSPIRINYVCKIPDSYSRNIEGLCNRYPIDKTFEIQLRTIFSEGWHEIEHDFRYKCKEDWENYHELSRTLNGVLATLENCDWAIASLFNDLAYLHYKNGEWIPMLKNKLRIRIQDDNIDADILDMFKKDSNLAKSFFRVERYELLLMLSSLENKVPLSCNNIIYLINILQIHNEDITDKVPDNIKGWVYNYMNN